MASKTLHSNQITFLDYTDNRRLDVYISSSLPTSQIYNPNTTTYSPDWNSTNLVLSADVYLDSQDITANTVTSIQWFKKIGTGTKTLIGSGKSISITTNEMVGNITTITYICEATYQNASSHTEITFARVDTGLNGTDGTSVTIKGAAYYAGELTNSDIGKNVVLYGEAELLNEIDTSKLVAGDAYIVQGYLCVYNADTNKFMCSGTIQGPKGEDGSTSPIVLLTNNNITFSADAQGRIISIEEIVFDTNVVGYNGTTKVLPIIEDITGLPDGMHLLSVTTIDNELKISFYLDDGATLGSALSSSGVINIPVISPIVTTLALNWSKINEGAIGVNGIDAVTFQVYSADGYILSKDTPSVMLRTFAYSGDTPIEAGATYQWYFKTDEEWIALTQEITEETTDETTGETTTTTTISSVTTSYVEISHTSVSFSCSYMCKMTFGDAEYVDVVTIEDKSDNNAVFTSKPTSYSEGDIWIVGSDYAPTGVEVGTVLKAQYTRNTYADEDWVIGTKYDDKLSNLETTVDTYRQYISLDSETGITMNAVDSNGNVSEFSATLSNTQLSFNQGDEPVSYINNHKMYITEAEIESPLTVTGKYSGSTMLQAPIINLGDFSLVIESNGSLSIVSNL